MTTLITQTITLEHLIILLGGFLIGASIALFLKNKKSNSIIHKLLRQLDDREEWIRMLEETKRRVS